MANTVDLTNLTEYTDSSDSFINKINATAELIQQSKTIIFFTGAGISTSAKIPDFRGPEGCWTNQALGKAPPKCIGMTQAIPTLTHMFISEMTKSSEKDVYTVSQNIDGLHRRSGIKASKISELHGNVFLETCWHCKGVEELRHFDVSGGVNGAGACKDCLKKVNYFCHCTSRKCKKCGNHLKDSIIHFKENLPEKALKRAFNYAEKADLCIVLGSSLTVSPANQIPKIIGKKANLVILNLQKTPLDSLAKIRIFEKTDKFTEKLAEKLGIEIPKFDKELDPISFVNIDSVNSSSSSFSSSAAANGNNNNNNSNNILENEVLQDLGGYVQPRTDCPHVKKALSKTKPLSIGAAQKSLVAQCKNCKSTNENWMCLTCKQIYCSRYVKGHMKNHFNQSKHPVAISFSDLNVWCYQCDQYILDESFQETYLALYLSKFGELPPGFQIESVKQ